MHPLIWTIIWSILPISELRGGIPYAILKGINPITAFLVAVLANIIIIPIIFFFLDHIHEFLLNMSHELRTPLVGILGLSSALKETKLNEEQRNYLDMINISAENLSVLINDIFEFSKAKENKLSLKNRNFDINQVLKYILNSFKYLIKEKKLKVELPSFSSSPSLTHFKFFSPKCSNRVLTPISEV